MFRFTKSNQQGLYGLRSTYQSLERARGDLLLLRNTDKQLSLPSGDYFICLSRKARTFSGWRPKWL